MKIIKSNFKKILALIFLLAYFMPAISLAATLSLNADKTTFSKNEDFLVEVFIDTKGVKVNAVGGKILFPSDLLELKEVRDGNSAVNFWVEKPNVDTTGEISFSGITPGGFALPKGFLFGLVFHSKTGGASSIKFSDLQALANDGIGSTLPVDGASFNFTLSNTNSSTKLVAQADTDAPEDFHPVIGKDPSIQDGKYFVVFSAADKGSGIDHYEVREGYWGKYSPAESPYILADQSLTKNIYIKAIDKSGNEKVAQISAQHAPVWLDVCIILAIILGVAVCLFLIKKTAQRSIRRFGRR